MINVGNFSLIHNVTGNYVPAWREHCANT